VQSQATNDFQPVIADINPEILRALEWLEEAGAGLALMSGSGSSVFGLFADPRGAERTAAALARELGWPCRALRTLETMPLPTLA
jgi:4-diphosphocytidyl-2-C-methyl-D-erythritol kinase